VDTQRCRRAFFLNTTMPALAIDIAVALP